MLKFRTQINNFFRTFKIDKELKVIKQIKYKNLKLIIKM